MKRMCFIGRGVPWFVVALGWLVATERAARAESFQDWLKKDREAMDQFMSEGTPPPTRTPAPPVPSKVAPTAPAVEDISYGYYYRGRLVSFKPSTRYVAVRGVRDRVRSRLPAFEAAGLTPDPVSRCGAAQGADVTILRVTQKGHPAASRTFRDFLLFVLDVLQPLVETRAAADIAVQPVFEQGGALLVPNDEVIVAFKNATSLWQARSTLTPYLKEMGIADVAPHRPNAFLITIRESARGRNHVAARFLAGLSGVAYAEPNHVLITLDAAVGVPVAASASERKDLMTFKTGPARAGAAAVSDPARAGWDVLASLDAESGAFPPAGWQAGWAQAANVAQATWGLTGAKAHRGSKSFYCAGAGAAAVAAPGPAPLNMCGILRSPALNLAAYKEVYVEFWFNAKNEFRDGQATDLGLLAAFAPNVQQGAVEPMGVMANPDCTLDPTTDKGWRRVLFRVPPAYRVDGAFFDFRYISDGANPIEGAYFDDVRIVASKNVDEQPLGNDTYGARPYELKNTGQIAGLGTDDNDLHAPESWDLVTVSPDVVVAVVDDGVELNHPDLNLVTGYDPNGAVGGGPKSSDDKHGTAVAGNVGAIRNNSRGVIGTAPGVKIMPIYRGGTLAEVSQAIDVAVARGARVMNHSWGGVGLQSADIEGAFRQALQKGCVVVIAAGNGPDRPPYVYDVAFPGMLTADMDVICVGASSPTDEHKSASSSDGLHAWGSSYIGPGPDIVAPGPWSYTTDRLGAEGYNKGDLVGDADYTPSFGGTSSSTPKVAGICALILSARPTLTPAEVKRILRDTADDIDAPGADDKTGAGRVNALKAVQAALKGKGSGGGIRVEPADLTIQQGE